MRAVVRQQCLPLGKPSLGHFLQQRSKVAPTAGRITSVIGSNPIAPTRDVKPPGRSSMVRAMFWPTPRRRGPFETRPTAGSEYISTVDRMVSWVRIPPVPQGAVAEWPNATEISGQPLVGQRLRC